MGYAVKEEEHCNVFYRIMLAESKIFYNTRATVNAAVLENDSKCKGLIALSFYDSKPVYFVTKHVRISSGSKKLVNFIIKKKSKR